MTKINLKKQAVELEGTRQPGQTGIYRNSVSPGKLDASNEYGVTTLYENFQNAVKINPNGNFLGHRVYDPVKRVHGDYAWQTYSQVDKRITAFGSGMVKLESTLIKSNKRDQWGIGIYSINNPEWAIAEQAANAYNLFTTALYDTLGPSAVEFIINHAEVPVCVTTSDKIPGLLKLSKLLPKLKIVISMDPLSAKVTDAPVGATTPPPVPGSPAPTAGDVLREWGKTLGVHVFDFAEVEAMGAKDPLPHNPPAASDLCCICYTSGTTGNPKGALLTHMNFISAAGALRHTGLHIEKTDVLISYLPLAHVFERIIEVDIVMRAAAIGYYRGDVLQLIDDISVLKPTLFPSVPRLFNRIYAKLRAQTVDKPGVVGALARKAVSDKLANLAAGHGPTHALWDRILFSKIRKVIGGRVRILVTGSAPISKDVLQFLRIAFCTDIYEGYGQTENTAYGTLTLKGEHTTGHVGTIAPNLEMKLVDVPEMSYLSTDKPNPRGEVCLRGYSVFKGYHKDPKKTEETIDSDGWLHTGDVGMISKRGTLSIIDRKKNIFKLAQGEYVAPESIEGVLALSPFVAQVYVHGDSLQSTLVAVMVPEPETFGPWAAGVVQGAGKTTSASGGTLKELASDPVVRKALLKEFDQVGREKKLRGFEFVKHVHIETEPFSVDNGLLTPTFKVKRQDLAKHYRKEIDEMYAELTAASPGPKL